MLRRAVELRPEQQGRALPAGAAPAADRPRARRRGAEFEIARAAAGARPSGEARALLAAGASRRWSPGRRVAAAAPAPAGADASPWPVSLVDVAAARRPHAPVRLRRRRPQALHHRDQRRRRRAPRLRQRRLARRARAQRHAAGRRRARADRRGPRARRPRTASTATDRDGTFEDVTDASGLRPHRLGLVGLRRRLRQRRLARPVRHLLRPERPLPQPRAARFEDVTGRAPGLPTTGTRWGSGCTLRRLRPRRQARPVRRELPALRPRHRARAGAGRELPVEGDPRQLRAQGPAHRHEPALPQRGRRPLHATCPSARASRRSPAAMPMTADRRRLRRRRLDRHLRGLRLHRRRSSTATTATARSPTSPWRAAWPTARWATPRPAWASASATSTRDGRLDLLKTHFADDIPALYRNLGRGQFEDVGHRRGPRPCRTATSSGARGMPDLDNDGWPDIVYVTGNVYPEIERAAAAVPAPRAAHRVPQPRRRRFEDVTARSGPGPLDAALQPRRRLRRLRQRRRRGRAGHEHERAAVAAAQRLRGRGTAGSRCSWRARARTAPAWARP